MEEVTVSGAVVRLSGEVEVTLWEVEEVTLWEVEEETLWEVVEVTLWEVEEATLWEVVEGTLWEVVEAVVTLIIVVVEAKLLGTGVTTSIVVVVVTFEKSVVCLYACSLAFWVTKKHAPFPPHKKGTVHDSSQVNLIKPLMPKYRY